MNSTAPDFSGLDPFINAFIVVALIGAVISFVIIGETLVAFADANRRTRLARRESIPTYYRRLITSH